MVNPSVKKNALMVKKPEMGGWCGWRPGKGVGVSGLGMKRVGEMSFEHRRCYWRKTWTPSRTNSGWSAFWTLPMLRRNIGDIQGETWARLKMRIAEIQKQDCLTSGLVEMRVGQGLLGFVFLQAVDCDWIRVVTKSFIREVLREDINLVWNELCRRSLLLLWKIRKGYGVILCIFHVCRSRRWFEVG